MEVLQVHRQLQREWLRTYHRALIDSVLISKNVTIKIPAALIMFLAFTEYTVITNHLFSEQQIQQCKETHVQQTLLLIYLLVNTFCSTPWETKTLVKENFQTVFCFVFLRLEVLAVTINLLHCFSLAPRLSYCWNSFTKMYTDLYSYLYIKIQV